MLYGVRGYLSITVLQGRGVVWRNAMFSGRMGRGPILNMSDTSNHYGLKTDKLVYLHLAWTAVVTWLLKTLILHWRNTGNSEVTFHEIYPTSVIITGCGSKVNYYNYIFSEGDIQMCQNCITREGLKMVLSFLLIELVTCTVSETDYCPQSAKLHICYYKNN